MTFFWFWYYLAEAKGWTGCLDDPLQCANDLVSKWLGISSGITDIRTTARTIAETYEATRPAYQAVLQPLAGVVSLVSGVVVDRAGNDFKMAKVSTWAANLGVGADTANMLLYADGDQLLHSIDEKIEPIQRNLEMWRQQSKAAFTWGRRVGYSVSFLCALMSLWRIVATFKKVTKRSQYERNMQLLLNQQGVAQGREEAAEHDRGPARGDREEGMQLTRDSLSEPRKKAPLALQQQHIQELLEAEYSVYFIGQSVMMFGVLASMMYLQIRMVGSLLVAVLTVLFHPRFWTQIVLGYHLWVPVLSLAAIIPINIWGVQWFFGSKVFSNGNRIKSAGPWMTYYIVSSMAFLVLGLLWAFWRFFWVLVKTLLYTVTCLDRNLLGCCPPDGPHAAFVATAKLEEAWLEMTERAPPDAYMTPACCPPCCPPPELANNATSGGGGCCCCQPGSLSGRTGLLQ